MKLCTKLDPNSLLIYFFDYVHPTPVWHDAWYCICIILLFDIHEIFHPFWQVQKGDCLYLISIHSCSKDIGIQYKVNLLLHFIVVASRSVQNPTDTSGTASGGTCGTLDHTNSITEMISGSKFTSSNASWKWLASSKNMRIWRRIINELLVFMSTY